MVTERIYRTDQYRTSCSAHVTGISEKKGFAMFASDVTVFYPEGGGQPSDTGSVTLGDEVFRITRASDEDLQSDVWHLTDVPAGTFREGDTITLSIDWDRRFEHMQRHLGEHMLSGAMHSMYDGVNKGFHMGDEYITIDIDLGGRMLTSDELRAAEESVNKAIWSDLPVTVSWFDDYESSKSLPVRKEVPHTGRVSVVTVGDLADPFDCIACCGTHPSSTGQVGLISIYKCEPNKGMNRIFFDCGSKALGRLSGDSRMLTDIAKNYSCSPADLPSRLQSEEAAAGELRARLAALSSYVRDAEKARIISGMDDKVSVFTDDMLSTDELVKLGFSVINEAPGKVLALISPAALTCLLFSSSDVRCGQLIKEHAGAYNARGGGRDDNARAVFQTRQDMNRFANDLVNMVE